MPVQIIMDNHGDSRHWFESYDRQATDFAEARFQDLTKKGYRAVVPGKRGERGRLLPAFDARVEETVFIPPLQGG